MLKKLIIVFLFPAVFLATTNSGSTGSSFLKINTGARSGALGGAFTGLAEDPEGMFFNPAGLAQSSVAELSGGGISWYADTSLQHAEFVLPLSRDTVLGFSGAYMNNGSFESYTSTGAANGFFSAYDVSAGLSLAVKFSANFMLGLTGKYILNNIASSTSASYAGDVGILLKELLPGISFGAAVNNLGTPVNFGAAQEPLPLAVRAGFAFHSSPEAVITVDGLLHPFEGDVNLCAGVELYIYEEYLVLRAGYNYPLNSIIADYTTGFSAGLGVTVNPVTINYSIIPAGELGFAHRVSASLAFGSKPKKITAAPLKELAKVPPDVSPVPATNEVTSEPDIKVLKTVPKVAILKPFISNTIKESQRLAMFDIFKSNLLSSKLVKILYAENGKDIPGGLNTVMVIVGDFENKGELIEITAALYEPSGKELKVFSSGAKSLMDLQMKTDEISKKIEQYILEYTKAK